MKLFFRICLGYALCALAAIMIVRDVGLDLLAEAGYATLAFGTVMLAAATWTLPLILLLPFIIGFRRFVSNLGDVGYAVGGSILFQASFSLVKSSIPFFVPFYADPPLAVFDRWLHGGNDPWVIAHDWAGYLPVAHLFPVYLTVWTFPAIGLVVFMALTDRDRERRLRFLALFFFCWIFLGSLLAIAGASAGPVFYDALLGGARFADLTAALGASPMATDHIAMAQRYLWEAYETRGVAFGSGISAFPSVHLAVATMTALYMTERNRWLALPGAAFVAVILFLSVYTGYHYAIDGYFSVLVVLAAWWALRRVRLSEMRPWHQRARPACDVGALR